jgi:hypothetical protein
MSRSHSPPTPSRRTNTADVSDHHPASPTSPHPCQPSTLNPNAPSSPSPRLSNAVEEELSEWLLFSPSSPKGSSPFGHFSGPSPALSYADVVRNKGKSLESDQSSDLHRAKGKEPMDLTLLASSSSGHRDDHGRPPSEQPDEAGHSGGFMAGAHRVGASRHPPPPPPEQAEEGWHLVTRYKQWRKIAIQAPSPQQPHRSVLTNLVGRCFNCLRQDHVAAGCPNATCCFRCHREGHYVRVCMKPRSPDTVGPSQRAKRPPCGGGATPLAGRRSVGPSALTATAEAARWCRKPSNDIPCYPGGYWAPLNHAT